MQLLTFTKDGNDIQNNLLGMISLPVARYLNFIMALPVMKYTSTPATNLRIQ